MAREVVPGGETERVSKEGGQDLFITIAMAMGGQSIEACVYALTRSLANVGLVLDDLDQASNLMRTIGEDAVNEIELNWPDRKQLLADAIATTHRTAGHG